MTLLLCLAGACAARGPTAREVAHELARDPEFVAAVSRRVPSRPPVERQESPHPFWPSALHREPVLLDRSAALATDEVVTTLAVVITAAGDLFLDGHPVTGAQLEATVRGLPQGRETRAVVAADARVTHARVVEVIDLLRRSGITRFAVNVESRP